LQHIFHKESGILDWSVLLHFLSVEDQLKYAANTSSVILIEILNSYSLLARN